MEVLYQLIGKYAYQILAVLGLISSVILYIRGSNYEKKLKSKPIVSSKADKDEIKLLKQTLRLTKDELFKLKELGIMQRIDFRKYLENLLVLIDFYVIQIFEKHDLVRKVESTSKATENIFLATTYDKMLKETVETIMRMIAEPQREMLSLFIVDEHINEFIGDQIDFKLRKLATMSTENAIKGNNIRATQRSIENMQSFHGTDLPMDTPVIKKYTNTGSTKINV